MKLTWVDERSAEGRLRAFWTPSIYMTLNKIEDASANSYLTTLHSRMTSVSENCLYIRLKSSGVRLPSKLVTVTKCRPSVCSQPSSRRRKWLKVQFYRRLNWQQNLWDIMRYDTLGRTCGLNMPFENLSLLLDPGPLPVSL